MAEPAQKSKEQALREVEAQLGREPGRIDLQIERARFLIDFGLFDDAKDVYLAILTQDPTQLVALNNLGALLNMMGYHKAALQVYREVVRLEPGDTKVRLNLADTLRECSELEEARGHYEIVLQQAPENKNAHRGLAYVLMYLGEKDAAWVHFKKTIANQSPVAFPARKNSDVPRIIVLASPCGGNSPIAKFLDRDAFQTLNLVPDFLDAAQPLPRHDLLINAVGDADHCATSLETAQRIVEQTAGPVLNPPARVGTTGRMENSRCLGKLEGVVTPMIATFDREILVGANATAALEAQGFVFPLLLRSPGFHEGSHFVRVENPGALAEAVGKLPGRRQLVIEYLDARDDDGKIRKYRVMMIGGRLYPLHKAISPNWMIHFYSADMAHSAIHRAEDAAFLHDMPAVLGPVAMRALGRIAEALGLDYAGADFSLNKSGEVLLFEANATMVIPAPDRGEQWDYRRAPVEKIQAAVREMLRARGAKTPAQNQPPIDKPRA